MPKYKILEKKLVYKGRIFNIFKEKILFGNKILNAEIIKHPGAVVIIPVLDNGELVFVRQFRPALKKFILEFPAGTLNKYESVSVAAKRELKEETGFTAKKIIKISEVIPVPGYSTEIIHIYTAKGLRKGKVTLDKDEILTTKILSVDDAFDLLNRGKIVDSKTIIGILLLKSMRII